MNKKERECLGDWLIEQNVRVARALEKMFHPLVESVVHDYRRPRQGVVAIFGGHVTGRRVGDPLTDIGKYRVRGKQIDDDLVGYASESSSGRKMRSASLALRLPDGELIGALCFNMDLGIVSEVLELLKNFTTFEVEEYLPKVERFRSRAPKEEVSAAVFEELSSRKLRAKQLSQEEREGIVKALAQRGLFSRRGAVTTIARMLGVTRPTVYRYLKEG
jgi:predicted transcriptional regulator YheO